MVNMRLPMGLRKGCNCRIGILLFLGCLTWRASAGPALHLVSLADPQLGPPSGGGGDSYAPILSRDGRYVLFASTANNLATVASNRPSAALFPAPLNVFLRDRVQDSTVLISVNLDATGGGNADSLPIGVSTNGRYALFESSSSNLVPGDTNNASDVFLRDVLAGTTLLVSVGTNGEAGDYASYNSAMTPDGRYVAFASAADNLVVGDTNTIPDVFVRDMSDSTTTLVSIGAQIASNTLTSVGSTDPLITPEGRFVAFYSTATNLVPGVNTAGNIYLHDRISGVTTWVSSGAQAALAKIGQVTSAVSFNHALSEDGRFTTFQSVGYSPHQNTPSAILRFDSQTGLTDLIETNAAVAVNSGNYESIQDLAMTTDGRFVAFVVNAVDNSGETTAIRVWDGQSGVSLLASGDATGDVLAGSFSDSPALSDDGRYVAFISTALDLVTNDIPGDFHMYVRDLQSETTVLVDVDTNRVGSMLDSGSTPALSANGGIIAFGAGDGSIVPADRNRAYDVFARDLTTGSSELLSAHNPGLASFTPDGPSSISDFSASADARFIAFWSEADDLVTNDANGLRDVYVRDTFIGTNVLVSAGLDGFSGNGFSDEPSISGDGRFVAFSSLANNLVDGDTNQAQDVFVRDLQTGITTLVSVSAGGTGPANKDSYSPIISSNGQSVLFRSRAGNLSLGMPVGTENLFWRDLGSARTYVLTSNGVTAASITPDGSRVAFITTSSRIAPSGDQLFVWDSISKSNVLSVPAGGPSSSFTAISISPTGDRIASVWFSMGQHQLLVNDLVTNTSWLVMSQPRMDPDLHFSADGRFLVYLATVPLTRTSLLQVYLYDIQNQTNLLVTRSYDGLTAGSDTSDSVNISADGRFVCYRSSATNLVPADYNGVPDIFLYDRLSGGTTLVTASRFSSSSADNRSLLPSFSPDGRTLLFTSWASDLLPNDFNNNADVFVLSLYDSEITTSFSVAAGKVNGLMPAAWLGWPMINGRTYKVQFKTNLDDPIWNNLAQPISVIGGYATVQDPAPAGARFYRVVGY